MPAITDSTGSTVVKNYGYKAFGDQLFASGDGMDVSNRFTGQVLDTDTGLYYYGTRYYDPQLDRFQRQFWPGKENLSIINGTIMIVANEIQGDLESPLK